MASPFSHPNVGNEVRVELDGKEVSLTFVCGTFGSAYWLADDLLRQLRDGALNITLMGKPSKVEEA
jgi:hypothetical protein